MSVARKLARLRPAPNTPKRNAAQMSRAAGVAVYDPQMITAQRTGLG